jgi:hypothetical protein
LSSISKLSHEQPTSNIWSLPKHDSFDDIIESFVEYSSDDFTPCIDTYMGTPYIDESQYIGENYTVEVYESVKENHCNLCNITHNHKCICHK